MKKEYNRVLDGHQMIWKQTELNKKEKKYVSNKDYKTLSSTFQYFLKESFFNK